MATKADKEAEEHLRKNPVNNFTCSCDGAITLPRVKFMEHLAKVHKLDTKLMRGKKSMMMHIDGSFWYSYTYQWELESGLKFTQYIEQARDKNDSMRFN